VSRDLAQRRFSHLAPLLIVTSCALNDPPTITEVRPQRPLDAGAVGAGGRGAVSRPAVDAGSSRVDAGPLLPEPPLPGDCSTGQTRACGPATELGNCALGTRLCTDGVWGDCVGAVMPGARLCGATDDKDCDGLPDDTVDTACECVPGAVEPCDTHPGFDNVGACRAGQRVCEASADGRSSRWGACTGSVAPATEDSCSVRGDDANCDAIPNSDCVCIEGETMPCGASDQGICRLGTSTCTNQRFGECVGAVLPQTRDCTSTADNDCDGRPDNTIDTVCTCRVAAVEACSTHPEDGVGLCRPGSRTCVASASGASSSFGACTGAVGPATRDCTSAIDNNCDGRPDNTIDAVCACVIGTVQACQTHPGLDNIGRCRAGQQLCVAGTSNSSAAFAACAGAVGPAAADSCAALGDDANCNGLENEGCACVVAEGNVGCTDPAASVCSAGACVPCRANADCALITGRLRCSSGLCVGCIADTDCTGGTICGATQTCQPPPVGAGGASGAAGAGG